MKKFLVITTINEPTEAIKAFAKITELSSWQIVVVGDKKTPMDWHVNGVRFISDVEQEEYKFKLPWNNYVRKMHGYLYAIKNGADFIAETDDDNIPKDDWCFPDAPSNSFDSILSPGFINIYKFFTEDNIWPRGLPFHAIKNNKLIKVLSTDREVGIWQALADEDPDVDAIYRMTVGKPCTFKYSPSMILEEGTVSPFNSQNTLFKKSMFPLLYLPVTVNQRFADILRGYVAQPVMWQAGSLLGFTKATVVQKRNKHNLMNDFVDEYPCYVHSEKAFNIAKAVARPNVSIQDNMKIVYKALVFADIVKKEEIKYLNKWLSMIGEK